MVTESQNALGGYSRDSSSVENVHGPSTKAGELHPSLVKTPHNDAITDITAVATLLHILERDQLSEEVWPSIC